jgi:hypothetical protein
MGRSEATGSLISAAATGHQIQVAGKRTLAVDAIGHERVLLDGCF